MIEDFEGKLEKRVVAAEKKLVQEVEEEVEKVERVIDTKLWKVGATVAVVVVWGVSPLGTGG